MRRYNFFIALFIMFFSCSSAYSSSLSELNYKKGAGIFLKNLPWSEKDPFAHPSFKVTKKKDKHKKEDPTKGAVAILREIEPPALSLSAIIFSDTSKSAVVDGQVVTVGSVIKEQTIIKINKNSVLVDFNGKAYMITLNEFLKFNGEK